jgi:hypothetical protein
LELGEREREKEEKGFRVLLWPSGPSLNLSRLVINALAGTLRTMVSFTKLGTANILDYVSPVGPKP